MHMSPVLAAAAAAAIAASLPANAQPAPNPAVMAFVGHPTHCQVLLGGDGYENDAASPEFSNALSDALGPYVGHQAVAVNLSLLETICRSSTTVKGSVK